MSDDKALPRCARFHPECDATTVAVAARAQAVFPRANACAHFESGSDVVRVEGVYGADWDITFADLQRLSAALGTTNINIEHVAETGAYSDLTPGEPSACRIVARVPRDGQKKGR
jgi:hypothetical protein